MPLASVRGVAHHGQAVGVDDDHRAGGRSASARAARRGAGAGCASIPWPAPRARGVARRGARHCAIVRIAEQQQRPLAFDTVDADGHGWGDQRAVIGGLARLPAEEVKAGADGDRQQREGGISSSVRCALDRASRTFSGAAFMGAWRRRRKKSQMRCCLRRSRTIAGHRRGACRRARRGAARRGRSHAARRDRVRRPRAAAATVRRPRNGRGRVLPHRLPAGGGRSEGEELARRTTAMPVSVTGPAGVAISGSTR